MKAVTKIYLLGFLGLFALSVRGVQVGDSRDSVIAELGRPQSKMSAGSREFLNYGSGRVELTSGVVSEVRGRLTRLPDQVEKSRPPVSQVTSSNDAGNNRQHSPRNRKAQWWTNLEKAKAKAKSENKQILALFTGSDWCPPCRRFEAEVAHDEQFAGIFSGYFVFFKNDWLRNTPQPDAVAAEVKRVKRKYGIRRYPTLKVLNADGEVLGDVNWTEVRGGGSFKEIMIEAIDDTRKATKGGKVQEKSWWPF